MKRLRYYIGARLLWPHVRRMIEHYELMSTEHNPNGGQAQNNCAYITIGLQHSIDKHLRKESASL